MEIAGIFQPRGELARFAQRLDGRFLLSPCRQRHPDLQLLLRAILEREDHSPNPWERHAVKIAIFENPVLSAHPRQRPRIHLPTVRVRLAWAQRNVHKIAYGLLGLVAVCLAGLLLYGLAA